MKWVLLSATLILYSGISLAQGSSSQKIDGLVNFDKDSTYWVAVVIRKGTVSTVFKMVFDVAPNQALPPDENYQIIYRPNLVQFVAVKGIRRYTFRTNGVAIPKRKGLQQWQVRSLFKINPADYPWVELKRNSIITSSLLSKPPLAISEIDTVPLPTPCDIAGPVISRAKNFVGTVLYYGHPEYHGNTGLYCIIYSIPNTIDSQKFGYVCNMPDKFKQKGLQVIFSGEYYHAYKDIKSTGRDGQALMYLRLESIRAL